MSAFISIAQLLVELREARETLSLSYDDKESAVRRCLRLSENFNGDVPLCLLHITQHLQANAAQLGEVISAVEPYSRLFADLWLSPSLPALLSLLCASERDSVSASVSARDAVRIAEPLLSMLRIGCKLVRAEQIPTHTCEAAVSYLCSLLAIDTHRDTHTGTQGERDSAVTLVEPVSLLLESLIPLDYTRHIAVLHRHSVQHRENAIVRVRYLSLAARLCAQSEQALSVCVQAGLLQEIMSFCLTDDLLLQYNAMELLREISATPAGLHFLCTHGAAQWLVAVSCGSTDTQRERNDIVAPEALRVLSSLFAHAAEHSFQFVQHLGSETVSQFLSTVMGDLEERDEVTRLNALGVISDFAAISAVSLTLTVRFAQGRLLRAWLELINSAKTETQSACMIALSKLFDQADSAFVENEKRESGAEGDVISVFSVPSVPISPEMLTVEHVSNLKQEILRSFGQCKGISPSHLLLKFAKQPISSLRNASMHLMRAIASNQSYAWPLHALFNTMGALNDPAVAQGEFWLFLRDRASEFGKDGKEYKFGLIETINAHPAKGLLPEEVARLLEVMVKEGPYYMPPLLHEMETV